MTFERVVYVVGTAAPPVCDLPRLFALLRGDGWTPAPILTPTAATWVDRAELAQAAGLPVRVEQRLPGEEEPLPQADAVLAAPLSFNTLNKWAMGINDSLALGLLNELLGTGVPMIASPCAKAPLRRHPVYARNLGTLSDVGVRFLNPERTIVRPENGPVTLDWPVVLAALNPSGIAD